MKTKKLSLNDFESVETMELLEVRGGGDPGGEIDNCPRCDSRRCNGASHSSFSDAWGAFKDALGGPTGLINPARLSAAVGSYVGSVVVQNGSYIYGNDSNNEFDRGSGYQQDIWATAYGSGNCSPGGGGGGGDEPGYHDIGYRPFNAL